MGVSCGKHGRHKKYLQNCGQETWRNETTWKAHIYIKRKYEKSILKRHLGITVEVPMTVSIKISIFWNATLCSFINTTNAFKE